MPDANTIIACATAINAFAAVVLVFITSYYAWQTHRTVDEMKQGRIHAMTPVLTHNLEITWSKGGGIGEFNTVLLQNVGNSPALDTILTLRLTNPNDSTLDIQSQEWNLGIVGINQRTVIEINKTKSRNPLSSSAQPLLEIISKSKNSYGIVSKTVAIFELQQTEPPQEVEPKKQFHWLKLKENVIIEK